jgi:polar amino acid transport system permease protein
VNFDAGTFFYYLWPFTAFQNPLIASGFFFTVTIALLAQLLAIGIGLLLALAKLSKFKLLRVFAYLYILYFRGTPVVVWLALLYFGSSALGLYQFPGISIFGLPVSGVVQAAVLGLGISAGAYTAETFRAGIQSVSPGQLDAARSLGMKGMQTLWLIVLPQALRVILPPLGNEFNNMIKATTLAVVIGGGEFFNAYEQINARIFQPFELFLAASVYYIGLTLLWDLVQGRIERHYGRPYARLNQGRPAAARGSEAAPNSIELPSV